MRRPLGIALAAGLGLALMASATGPAQAGEPVAFDAYTFGDLRARAIGPAITSGRIASIDGVGGDPPILWVGAASGGVWRSRDGGIHFDPVFDEHVQSIGAVRIDRRDPDTVWVGTGESWVRNSVGIGDGVYKTTDAGESWVHLGLEDTEHISAIRIDGDDSDTVYVCALGHAWDANEQRGVFKTTDGGQSWQRVLFVDRDTGCADLDLDPTAPNILYAAMWEFRRYPDFFTSGGPGSGLYRSTDGGASWQRLTRGLPEGDLGRIAVAIAPSRPTTVYAVVESADTALYRSDDLGATWARLDSSMNVQVRPFYFAELVVDPQDHLRVYKPGLGLTISTDGGRTFTGLMEATRELHSDHHALWIDPDSPNRLVLGTDGGVYMSYDRAASWRMVRRLPVAQLYHVSTDDQWPYNVYGGLQDNGSWVGPSRSPAGIEDRDWDSVGVGDGFWVFADPDDPSIVYSEYQGGRLLRVDRRLGEIKRIAPIARDGEEALRFNWNAPLHPSPVEPGTLYFGSQYVHRSRDRGESWQRISPDLTTDEPRRQRQAEAGGLTIDNSTAENNATIYSISASPLDGDVIWAGSDDGRVHVTRDGGATWTDVTANVPGVPAGTWVSRVEASPHDEAAALLAFDGHRTGDMRPYVFATRDAGASWEALGTEGVESFVWVVKHDPVESDLLFLGTEMGLYISLDAGSTWARFDGGLPPVAVHDLVVQERESDLVVATHGRGVYILDDLSALRALTEEVIASDVALLPSRPAVMSSGGPLQRFVPPEELIGFNPPDAVAITYYLKSRHLFGDLEVSIYDRDGELITSIPGGKRRGINRVYWPMRLKPPELPPSTALVAAALGPRVPEGDYRVELVKGERTLEGTVHVLPDPRSPHAAEDRRLQQRVALELYAALGDLTYLVGSVDLLADQARDRASGAKASEARKLLAFADALGEMAASLAARGTRGWLSGEKRLRELLGDLYGAVVAYDGRPTETQLERQAQLRAALDQAARQVDAHLADELPRINRLLAGRDAPPLERLMRAQWNERASSRGSATPEALRSWDPRIAPLVAF